MAFLSSTYTTHLFGDGEIVVNIIVTPDHEIAALAQDGGRAWQIPCEPA
jgi:hypothetical protein